MCLTAFFYAVNFITVCDSGGIMVASKWSATLSRKNIWEEISIRNTLFQHLLFEMRWTCPMHICCDLKSNRSNNKVLAWLIAVSATDSWWTADFLSPNFVLILISLCKVVAWPFFTIPLLGSLSASVSLSTRKAHQWSCRCLYCQVPSLDLWLIVGILFITKVRSPCSLI